MVVLFGVYSVAYGLWRIEKGVLHISVFHTDTFHIFHSHRITIVQMNEKKNRVSKRLEVSELLRRLRTILQCRKYSSRRRSIVRASINRSTPDCNFPLRFFLVASYALYRSQFNSIILHTTSLLIHLMPTSILFANSHNNANSCWSLLKATDDCSSLE